MKRKYIIKAMIWFVLIVALIKIGIIIYGYEEEKKRLAQEPYYTKYELDSTEMDVLKLEYHMRISPPMDKLSKEDNKDIWPDFRFVTIEATDDTEVVVTVMNYILFDKREEWNKESREKAEKYGITTDNRLTEEWVIEHPREAVDIMYSMIDNGYDFIHLWIKTYSLYEEITGIQIED